MTGISARRVALDVLRRIDEQGAFANLALGAALGRTGLSPADRRFVTDLVYGTTRMRRACDWLVDRFLTGDVEPVVRSALRLGAYQLAFQRTPAHAAVGETVEVTPKRARGLVNAVLRKVATASNEFPSEGIQLSYPDWILDQLIADLGRADAVAALETMNRPAEVTERADGYVQDQASQWVTELVDARPGELVLDACAAPGGKATGLAATGAQVAASDHSPTRARLVRDNATRVGASGLWVVTADGRRPPFRDATFDRVLVDAPCSGLGVLRRRPDARWRLEPGGPTRLAELQRQILDGVAARLRPRGTLVYSVCTLTAVETLQIDDWLAAEHPELEAGEAPGEPWRSWGRGALLLPQAAGTDGMFLLRLTRVPVGIARRD